MPVSSDFTPDYALKRITHTSGSTVYTANQLYTWTTQTFDDDVQMDDTIPISAQTPTAFTLINGWFMSPASFQYINGGSLQTSGWDATSNNDGIRVLTFKSSGYSVCGPSDIGTQVVYTDGSPTDSGRLLAYDNTLRKWWVRVDSTDDNFSNTSIVVFCSGGNGQGTLTTASVTGENIWTNIYTLGTIADNTQIYLYQNSSQITPWWTLGHINVLILVKEAGTLIDSGNLTILARQYSILYDHYTADLSSGNQTPIPLATFTDTNNIHGYRQFTGSSGSGSFLIGDLIQKSGDATVQGVITAVNGGTSTPTITYYLFSSPFTDFQNGNSVIQVPAGPTCTAGIPGDTGPASLSGTVTITFGTISRDLNNGNGARNYDVEIDCQNTALSSVYEYLKYVTRYGAAGTLNSVQAEAYISANGSYAPVKQSPFGTFAGGTFFGARGVWLKNVPAGDANNYQLIDDAGVTQIPPTVISLTVNGVQSGDRVGMFKTTGANTTIERNTYTSHASSNVLGNSTFVVQSSIAADTPVSGVLRVIDVSLNNETRYTYTSWSGSTFSGVSPTLVQTYTGSDTAYVPYIDTQASGTSVTQTITYATDRNVLTVVRIKGVVPFQVQGTILSSGITVTAIRNVDSVFQ